MIDLNNILKSHLEELKGNFKTLSDARLSICHQCPLYERTTTVIRCNPHLSIKKETTPTKLKLTHPNNTITFLSKQPVENKKPPQGYIKGCGCRISAKASNPYNHCPSNLWDETDKDFLTPSSPITEEQQQEITKNGLAITALKHKIKLRLI